MNDYKTQKRFFEVITKKKLNELLHRATDNTLEQHINANLEPPLSAAVKLYYNKTCDIYINYMDDGKRIGHFSIHCKLDDVCMTPEQRKHGRIHLKNNLNYKYYTMKCNKRILPNANVSVTMSYSLWQFIKPALKLCIDATLFVLNEYMDFNSELSLDIPMTVYNLTNHRCMNCFDKFESHYKTKFKQTRKASVQTKRLLGERITHISHA